MIIKIAIAGDWHGNTKYTLRAVDYAYDNDADIILHVGDFGFQFEDDFMQPLNARLKDRKLEIWTVQGNHDNPYILNAAPRLEDGSIQLKSNIFHLPRNYRWNWNDVSFLALGGAASVDRTWRTAGVDWWPEEVISMQEAEQAIQDGHADVMICHDAPAGPKIRAIENNPMGWPAHAIREAEAHRDLLRVVFDYVRPKFSFHGHYHTNEKILLVGKDYQTETQILDCDGTPLSRNTCFFEI